MTRIATRIDVVRSVGAPLCEAEAHLDAAFKLLAEVQIAAVEGRAKARLPLDTGHDALAQIVQAQQALMTTRNAVHTAHYGFRAVQDTMGVDDQEFGDHGDTPREAKVGLTVVAHAA